MDISKVAERNGSARGGRGTMWLLYAASCFIISFIPGRSCVPLEQVALMVLVACACAGLGEGGRTEGQTQQFADSLGRTVIFDALGMEHIVTAKPLGIIVMNELGFLEAGA